MNESHDGNETNSATNSRPKTSLRTISETEFVSDTFQTTDKDLEEVKAGMKRLGIDSLAQLDGKNGKIIVYFIYLRLF